MSTRAGWTFAGKHFAETYTERGGKRYFIDGKPTRLPVWRAELHAARNGANPSLLNPTLLRHLSERRSDRSAGRGNLFLDRKAHLHRIIATRPRDLVRKDLAD